MALSSFSLVMLSALVLAITGAWYVLRIQRVTVQTRRQRKQLMHRSEATNLPRMLQALGIGPGRYFYTTPLNKIDKSISHCETCQTADQCHSSINSKLKPNDIEFCRNLELLTPLLRSPRASANR